MAERSTVSTDVKIWLQSLGTLLILMVAGYFGVTLLGSELAGSQPEAQTQATLPVYEAPEEGDGDQTGGATPTAGDGEGAVQPEATPPAAEESPDAGMPGVDAGNGAGVPDARLTAIAQGTMLPGGEQAVGATPGARLTAIAQGTFSPRERATNGTATNGTPAPTPIPTDAMADSAGIGEEAAMPAPEPGTGLFAVARGTGATLYDRPEGEVVSELVPGSTLSALARSEDGLWALVQSVESAGWAPLEQLVLFDADSLPVLGELGQAAVQPPAEQAGTEQGGTQEPGLPADGTPGAPSIGLPTATPQPVEEAPVPDEYIEPVLARVASEDARLNVRAGSGTEFDIVEKVNPGEEFIVLARTASGDWVQIALPTSAVGSGWVAAEFVELVGDLDSLPVAEPSGESAPEPEPEDAAAIGLPTPTPEALPATSRAPDEPRAEHGVGGEPAPAAEAAGVDADRLILRSGPGEEYGVETDVEAGLEFIELDRSAEGDWVRIAILEPPGGVGWVAADVLGVDVPDDSVSVPDEPDSFAAESPSGPPTPGPVIGPPLPSGMVPAGPSESILATVISQDAFLNVRAGPGTGYAIVRKVEPGDVFAALSRSMDGDWVEIALSDAASIEPATATGWVAAEYVDLSAGIDQLEVSDAREAETGLGDEGSGTQPADVRPPDGETATSESEGSDALDPPEFLPEVGARSASSSAGPPALAAEIGGVLVFEQQWRPDIRIQPRHRRAMAHHDGL